MNKEEKIYNKKEPFNLGFVGLLTIFIIMLIITTYVTY